MTATSPVPARAPRHLWIIGGASLLWNAVGALDFSLTQARHEGYLASFTPEQKAYFVGFPAWVVFCWGVATWGSVVGSFALLVRRRVAQVFFVASFLTMVATTVYNFILTDGLRIIGGGAGMIVFSAAIFVVALLLVIYTRAMTRQGWLR